MDANSYQVGGSHYRSPYIHWDLVIKVGLCYFTGNATKYVYRWRKKGGLEDLKKALHYLNKLQESGPTDRKINFPVVVKEVTAFNNSNNLPDLERAFIASLCTWQLQEDLNGARELLFLLMNEAEALGKAQNQAVPLAEENHHADRASDDPLGR